MKLSFTVEGGKEVAAALGEYSRRWQTNTLKEALLHSGEPMRAAASRYAPRGDPGGATLSDIVIAPLRREGTDIATVAIGPKYEAFYGFFQEYGTVHHGAHAFMRPAFDGQTPATIKALIAFLWVELAAKGHIQTSSAPSGLGGLV